jgi:hypothetical protein
VVARSTIVFFLLMGGASAIGIIKFWLLATVLPKADFALYSAVYAAAVFGSSFVSLGSVEGSLKSFAQLAHRGEKPALLQAFGTVVRQLLVRHALLFAVAIAALAVTDRSYWLAVLGSVVLSLNTTLFGLAASLYRSLGRMQAMALTTLARVVLAAAVAVGLAYILPWQQVFAVESMVLMGLSAALVFALHRMLQALPAQEVAAEETATGAPPENILIFVAFTMAAVPLSIDRMAAVTFAGAGPAAPYAFIAIFISAAYTFASIYAQKAGPELLRARLAAPGAPLLGITARHVALVSIANAMLAASGLIVCHVLFYDTVFLKYGLTFADAALTVLAAALQFSIVPDWALIAQDRERRMVVSSAAFVLIWAAGFAVSIAIGGGAAGLVIAMIGARIAQAVLQFRFIAQNTTPPPQPLPV